MGRADTVVNELATNSDQIIETHISWVLIRGDDVYKIKKPVRLEYLDFSTSDLRHAACEAEVNLNRRLAEDVYHGVVPISRDSRGRLALGENGEVVDWAVHMRRLPEAHRADARLAAGGLQRKHLEQTARTLADFHANAPVVDRDDAASDLEGLTQHVAANLDELGVDLRQTLGEDAAEGFTRRHCAELARRRALLTARSMAGRCREGHGDFRLEHVYLDEQLAVRVIDCVEFQRAFRVADVAADAAFLSMDLRRHGSPELAEDFLAAYAQHANDHDIYALLRLYETHWALVRAKVASTSARDEHMAQEQRDAAQQRCQSLIRLADRLSRSTVKARPCVIVTAGLIASGKSHTAHELGGMLHAPVISSDRVRSAEPTSAGASPDTPAFAGAYSNRATGAVYDELLRRAGVVLRSGRPVVLDASFRRRRDRDAVRTLAAAHGAQPRFFECFAPREEIERRLARRDADSGPSDARRDLLDAFEERYEPFERDELDRFSLDTDRPATDVNTVLRAHVEALNRTPSSVASAHA